MEVYHLIPTQQADTPCTGHGLISLSKAVAPQYRGIEDVVTWHAEPYPEIMTAKQD